ncbi:prephenate dehydratase [Oceanobacillus oncorhynchi]|uniref:prephenate dehydratase n=1 Tax=Oceanobacillus oncorhynchi TaxID=545501 RepID=UPI0025A36AB5|nr:prephenate dehydratase domain-containing protein [Oceanobacillus oncorhynchi]MDM8102766.1 prephenate dehydratase domain-containing protein [Oceanobacillus oncorhynchi]
MLIGYQGVEGSYSTIACQKFSEGNNYQTKGYPTFPLLVDALLHEEVDYIALPVENATSGPITRTIDLLKYVDVTATDEIYVKIDHALITKHPIELSEITKVYSHPEALKQCDTYLSQYPHIEVIDYMDTAGAVEMVKHAADHTIASIAGSHAAALYGMTVMQENINDNPFNTTRFLFFKKKKELVNQIQDKTSMYVEANHSTGLLSDMLHIFKKHAIDVLYVMPRPVQSEPFAYGFFIDIDNGAGHEALHMALKELEDSCTYINILGNYRKGKIPAYKGALQHEKLVNR